MKSKKAITLLVLTTLLMALIPVMPMASAVIDTGIAITSTDIEDPFAITVEQEFHVKTTSVDAYSEVLFNFVIEDALVADIASIEYYDADTEGWTEPSSNPETGSNTWLPLPYSQSGDDVVGTYGPGAGFAIPTGYEVTGRYRITFLTTGTYDVTVNLEDISGIPVLIATSSFEVTVNEVVELDSTWYQIGDTVTVTVTDAAKNTAVGTKDTVDVTVISTIDPTPEFSPLTLTETGVDTGIFTGTFKVVGYASDTKLKVADGNTITVTYVGTDVEADITFGEGFTIDYVTSGDIQYDDTLTIAGSGVTAGADVNVYWDYVGAWDGEKGLLNVTDGNPSGTFDLWVDVPSGLVGDHYLWFRDESTDATLSYGPLTMVPRIKMSPSSGLEGDEITIKGYGFGDEVDIVIITGATGVSPSTPETDELGYWTAKFDAGSSTFTVEATDDDGNVGSKLFAVGPAIELDVEEGPVGTIVEVSGRGFTKTKVVIVDYPLDTDAVTVKTDGTFTIDVVIPQLGSTGDYIISVTETGNVASAEADFDVVGLAEIEVTPGHGTQGSTVTVEGWNFTAGEDVSISVGPLFKGEEDYEVDNDGTFSVSYQIPAVMTGPTTLYAKQTTYGIEADTEFRAGIMIVILNPTSGPSGTSVTLTGTGFSADQDWNATFGDETWSDDEQSLNTEISAVLYVPSVDTGVHIVSIWDVEADIQVDVEFEVTATTMIETDPVVAPPGYEITLYGYNFAEPPSESTTIEFDDIVLYNDTEEWSLTPMYKPETGPSVETELNLDEDWDDGYFEGYFTLPDEDDLSVGTYYLNVTDDEGLFAQLVFEVVEETIDIDTRKVEFRVSDTLAFEIESSFPMANSYIEISDPSGDLYWSTDPFKTTDPDMWLTVGNIQRVLYADQVAGGNPMVFLDDAPLGTWTWEYIDESQDDDEEVIDSGAFTVTAGAADLVSGQVADLAADIDALVAEIYALADDLIDYSSEFDSVKDDIAGVADLARAAADAATSAAEAVSSVATVAGDAADAADKAAEAALAAKDAASGLTTLVYGAIGASLVAALAAIISLMQISRRIAG